MCLCTFLFGPLLVHPPGRIMGFNRLQGFEALGFSTFSMVLYMVFPNQTVSSRVPEDCRAI